MTPVAWKQMEQPNCVLLWTPFQMPCHFWTMILSFPLWIFSAMAEIGSLTRLEITHGPDNIIVATETEAALHCAVHGFPLPIVHWFRNSQPLQNDSHRSLQNHGQLLFFKNVSEEDEGFYYCEAKNEGKTVRSQMAFLLPAVMEWNFVQQPNNETARREESVTLTCRPPHSRPPALVTWFKNNRLINPMPHFSLQPNGDLLFHSVQDKDRGIYFCRASNAHLFRAVSSRKVYLNVLAPPSVDIWPVVVTAALGSEVRFQCQVSGNPIPSITWSKQGWSVFTGGKVTIGVRNATLYLSSVKSYDEGFYTCEASNAVGHARGTASLRISDGGAPHISKVQWSDRGDHCTAENTVGQDQRTTTLTALAEADPGGFTAGEGEEDSGVTNSRTEQRISHHWINGPSNIQNLERIEATSKDLGIHIQISGNFPENTSPPAVMDRWDVADSSVPGSMTLALQASLGKGISAPPTVESLPPVMQSELSLFPSLSTKWTPSVLHHGLLSFEELVLKTDRLAGTKLVSVSHHSQTMVHQSSLDEEMSGVYSGLSATPLLAESLSLFPQPHSHSSPSQSHFPLPHHDKLLPHRPPFRSCVAQTFPCCQSQALSPDSQSRPTGPHSQPLGHDSPAQSVYPVDGGRLPDSGPKKQNASQAGGSAESGEIRFSEWPKKNSSQHPMRKSGGTTRIKPESTSWLPVLEKHDIPIVVGVGVSLAFIFITMAFYSLVQKNEPAPIGRAAHRNLGLPHRRTGRPETRTYENRAFEDDSMVAVIEQSPNTRTQAPPSALNTVTMVMEPPKTSAVQSQPPQDQTAVAETHPEPNKESEETIASPLEKEMTLPLAHPNIQDVDDFGGEKSGQCQDAYNAPPSSPLACREEGIHTFLMLQTTESSTTPIHHSVSMSHDSAPLLVSHSVSFGVTTVAVDVHFYPAASPFIPTSLGPRDAFQLVQEPDQTDPKVHNAPRTCL